MSLLGLSSVSLLVGACADGGGAGITMSARSRTGAPPVAADQRGAAFTMQQGLLHLRSIELDLPSGQGCDDVADALTGATCHGADQPGDQDKVRVDGPFVVDLVAGTSTPSLATVVIPAGTYQRIDLRVDDGRPAEGLVEPGSPLDRNALAVVAAFDHGGAPAVLDLRLNFDEDIRIERPGGVAVAPGDDLIARFAAVDWLAGVDLGACVGTLTAVDGRFVIDDRNDGACAGIESTVKDAMKRSGDLDADGSDD